MRDTAAGDQAFLILSARMHEVHTHCRLTPPDACRTRMRWRFGLNLRLVWRWELLTFEPTAGRFPQTVHILPNVVQSLQQTVCLAKRSTSPRRRSCIENIWYAAEATDPPEKSSIA